MHAEKTGYVRCAARCRQVDSAARNVTQSITCGSGEREQLGETQPIRNSIGSWFLCFQKHWRFHGNRRHQKVERRPSETRNASVQHSFESLRNDYRNHVRIPKNPARRRQACRLLSPDVAAELSGEGWVCFAFVRELRNEANAMGIQSGLRTVSRCWRAMSE
jgi:hypothetical protein